MQVVLDDAHQQRRRAVSVACMHVGAPRDHPLGDAELTVRRRVVQQRHARVVDAEHDVLLRVARGGGRRGSEQRREGRHVAGDGTVHERLGQQQRLRRRVWWRHQW
jgi:hypothetical protein